MKLTPTDAQALLAQRAEDLSPETREALRDFWLRRLVRAIFGIGSDEDDEQRGLVDEFRGFKRIVLVWGSTAGAVTLALQFIGTFNFAEPLKHAIIHMLGGQ